ncbi:MAG TPA: hypothetical protein GX507_09255, partial [Clostridia bacterium]|nr:hypothetical protein [Clostridia bacterium]
MILITGGTLYDPANGIDGRPVDILVDGGKVIQVCEARCGRRSGEGLPTPEDSAKERAEGVRVESHGQEGG